MAFFVAAIGFWATFAGIFTCAGRLVAFMLALSTLAGVAFASGSFRPRNDRFLVTIEKIEQEALICDPTKSDTAIRKPRTLLKASVSA